MTTSLRFECVLSYWLPLEPCTRWCHKMSTLSCRDLLLLYLGQNLKNSKRETSLTTRALCWLSAWKRWNISYQWSLYAPPHQEECCKKKKKKRETNIYLVLFTMQNSCSEVCAGWHDGRRVCPYEQKLNALRFVLSNVPLIICLKNSMSVVQFSKELYVEFTSSYSCSLGDKWTWGKFSLKRWFRVHVSVVLDAQKTVKSEHWCRFQLSARGGASTVPLNQAQAQLPC